MLAFASMQMSVQEQNAADLTSAAGARKMQQSVLSNIDCIKKDLGWQPQVLCLFCAVIWQCNDRISAHGAPPVVSDDGRTRLGLGLNT